jgi:spore photoproduct lyase
LKKKFSTHPTTQTVLKNVVNSQTKIHYFSDFKKFLAKYKDAALLEGACVRKEKLVLLANRGRFITKCPGTKNHLCCNYYVLHNGLNCLFDCSYCFLNFYTNNPFLTYYVNTEDLCLELENLAQNLPKNQTIRIGSGEYTDSLALDPLTQESSRLLPIFHKHQNLLLELKTKSKSINGLKRYSSKRQSNIVIAWSLNPRAIISQEEHGTASLTERLASAKQCGIWGYRLAFHFDPLIYYPGWEEAYSLVVKKLFAAIKPEQIAWISLGTLRYHPKLSEIILAKFPDSSRLIFSETVLGTDDKVRYFKPLRIKMYQTLVKTIQAYTTQVPLYLCMEDHEVWQKVFSRIPDYKNPKDFLFYRALKKAKTNDKLMQTKKAFSL